MLFRNYILYVMKTECNSNRVCKLGTIFATQDAFYSSHMFWGPPTPPPPPKKKTTTKKKKKKHNNNNNREFNFHDT